MGNLLDRLFKDKLKSRRSTFDQENWVEMELLLNGKSKKRRAIPIWFTALLGTIIIVSILGGVLYLKNNLVNEHQDSVTTVGDNAMNYNKPIDKSNNLKNALNGDVLEATNNLKNGSSLTRQTSQYVDLPDLKEAHTTGNPSMLNTDNDETEELSIMISNVVNNEIGHQTDESIGSRSIESINGVPVIMPQLAGFIKTLEIRSNIHLNRTIQELNLRPEFGISSSFLKSDQTDIYEFGFFTNIGLSPRWSIGLQGLYSYFDFDPFILAQETGNIYSFDVSNYEQEIIAKYAHGMSFDLAIAYHIGSSSLSIGLHEQVLLAVMSDRLFRIADNEDQLDEVWTDRKLYDAWQLSTRFSYAYAFTSSMKIGVFYNYSLGENDSFDQNNNFGINLKWSL